MTGKLRVSREAALRVWYWIRAQWCALRGHPVSIETGRAYSEHRTTVWYGCWCGHVDGGRDVDNVDAFDALDEDLL